MVQITIEELEDYLYDHYRDDGVDQSLFMKLVEEIGEVAEVLNKKAGRKASGREDLQLQLGNELADVIHYAVAIAALNGLNMNDIIMHKDQVASIKISSQNQPGTVRSESERGEDGFVGSWFSTRKKSPPMGAEEILRQK